MRGFSRTSGAMIFGSLAASWAFADLTLVPGQNGVQSATAQAVQTICPQMGALGGGQGELPQGQQQLFERCRELVQTSNAQQGAGGTAFDLGLNEQGLRDAIQRIAPEEVGAMASGSTDTSVDQMGNVIGRLSAVRGNFVSPSSVASLNWSSDSMTGGAAGDEFSRLGLFVTATGGFGEKDQTSEENGFEYDNLGLTVGMDYRFSDNLVAGFAVDYSETDVELDLGFGDSGTESIGASFYGTYYTGSFYIDGLIGFGQQDYDSQRNIIYANVNDVVSGDTDGNSFSFSIGAGYDTSWDALNGSFYVRVQSNATEIDGFAETGSELAMLIGDQDVDSLRAVLGGQMSKAFSKSYGVLMPYASFEFHHEFDDEQRSVVSQYVFDPTATSFSFLSDAADENFGVLGLGLSLLLPRGNQMFFSYDTVLGLDDVSSHVFSIGMRFEL